MGVSLVDGWLPILLSILGIAGGLYLIYRPKRWWWIWYLPASVVVAAIAGWIISTTVATDFFASDLPFLVGVWIAIAIAAPILAIGHLFGSRWPEKVIAIVAAVLVVAAAGNQVNIHFQQYPRLGDFLGVTSDAEISGPPRVADTTQPTEPTEPLTQAWRPTGANIPDDGLGKVSDIDLPGTVSGFEARPGKVYYPPAYFADNPMPLPVLIALVGQPGDPGDWFLGDRVQNIMNEFAQAHDGIAPIVVSPDPLGSLTANPLCADSSLGKVDTYLSKDVPDGIKKQLLVSADPRHWVVAGFSYGGTCAIQLATNHPDVYPNFVDISGELEPTLGSRQQTVDTAFGGDEAAFKAINPMDIMASKKFPNSAGWFIVGADDSQYGPQQQQVYQAAQAAGMNVQFWESPGTAHDWGTAVAGLSHVMPWMAQQMHLTS